MTIWTPNQPVDDRFAIRLPTDLAPGRYTLRLGIYRPDNNLRLRVTRGADAAPDFVNLGYIDVQPR